MKTSIADIRREYSKKALNRREVSECPIDQFNKWFDDAMRSNIDDANAMTLSTVSETGRPSGRIVLLKAVENNQFVFFTNYKSKKGIQIDKNPFVSLTFYWKELERQVRVEGKLNKVSKEISDQYFQSRPRKSRIGAWISDQSQPIKSRYTLIKSFLLLSGKYIGKQVPLPEHWGGYALTPDNIEFWQGRPSRLHDRINYKLENGDWSIERLAP